MDVNVTSLQERGKVEAKSYLEQLLSEGSRKLLQATIENEVAEYLQSQSGRRSESGERSVVRNGHLPERDLVPFERLSTVNCRTAVRHWNTFESPPPNLPRYDRLEPHAIGNNKAPLPPTNDTSRSPTLCLASTTFR
jgi:hypothetical protein